MVSVVTTVYNGAGFLLRCVEQVVMQSLGTENLEHVIVDDASTDETAQFLLMIAKKHSHITILSNTDKVGRSNALNKGIDSARFDLIAILDVDDLWNCNKLQKQIEHAALVESGNVLFTKSIRIEDDIVDDYVWRQGVYPRLHSKSAASLILFSSLSHSSCLFSKKYYRYSENFSNSQYDLNLYFDVILSSRQLFVLSEVLTVNTIHVKQNYQFQNKFRYSMNSLIHRYKFIKKGRLYVLMPILCVRIIYVIVSGLFKRVFR